jgi:long-subunit acyl-CoA synthetase (AMP-forming)
MAAARGFLRALGLAQGDRCVLLAQNSANWIALTLALRADGLVSVPLYVQRPLDELAAIIGQCEPALICGDDPVLLAEVASRTSIRSVTRRRGGAGLHRRAEALRHFGVDCRSQTRRSRRDHLHLRHVRRAEGRDVDVRWRRARDRLRRRPARQPRFGESRNRCFTTCRFVSPDPGFSC